LSTWRRSLIEDGFSFADRKTRNGRHPKGLKEIHQITQERGEVTRRFVLSFPGVPADRSREAASRGRLAPEAALRSPVAPSRKVPAALRPVARLLVVLVAVATFSEAASAYTANKIWFEFRPNGIYRVHVNYTVPELKEFREAYVEFTKKADAERYYFDLVRGADFYLPTPGSRRFVGNPLKPEPW
jgi:hypothetical protein